MSEDAKAHKGYLNIEDPAAKATMAFINVVANRSIQLGADLKLSNGQYLAGMCTALCAIAEQRDLREQLAVLFEEWAVELRNPNRRIGISHQEAGHG
jgi:hypothetical protein